MNYLNAAPSKLAAALLSSAITVVVTASIVFGMAGLPKHDNAQLIAATPAGVQG